MHIQTLQFTPTFVSPITPIMSRAKARRNTHLITVLNALALERPYGTSKNKYADSVHTAYRCMVKSTRP
jgi:hypothetical protein